MTNHPPSYDGQTVLGVTVSRELLSQGECLWANQSVESRGGSRSARRAFVSRWRLPPVAHAER